MGVAWPTIHIVGIPKKRRLGDLMLDFRFVLGIRSESDVASRHSRRASKNWAVPSARHGMDAGGANIALAYLHGRHSLDIIVKILHYRLDKSFVYVMPFERGDLLLLLRLLHLFRLFRLRSLLSLLSF